MNGAAVIFNHQELSLLVYVLEGADEISTSNAPADCEQACPVADHFEALFEGESVPREKRLVNHLNNHLREGLIECGAFEMMAARQASPSQPISSQEQAKLNEINGRLKNWSCEIKLDEADRQLLYQSISRLPRSAWISMPRTLWRLKKKLKRQKA